MRKLYLFLSLIVLNISLSAQAPQKFSYQALVRNASNTLVVNQKVGTRISILQTSATGVVVYTERHEPTTNANGLITLEIGGGTVILGDFNKIDWAKGPFYVRTETDPFGGTEYTISGESQLLSVPYALFAANATPGKDGLDGKDGAQGIQGPKGDKGDAGKDGLNGKDGVKGPKGDTGATPQIIVTVSLTGDTLKFENGNYIIIPGISAANSKTKPTSGYGPTITDVDGNTYKTVYIGTQQWMGENLKTSKYSDGTTIPNIKDNTQWVNVTTGAWSNYNNSDSIGSIYGKLYNWYVINPSTNGNKNVCPTDWHTPNDTEWKILTDYLGGAEVAGAKMRSTELTYWNTLNEPTTNSALFFGLAGGMRNNGGDYNDIKEYATWWSSDNIDSISASFNYLLKGKNGPNSCSFCTYISPKLSGLSIRCLKD